MTYQPRVASTQDPFNRLWTVEEYRQLVHARLVGVNEPVNLVEGQIVRCNSPQTGPSQAGNVGNVQRLSAMLQRCVGNRAKVRVHHPIVLSHNSELRPDIAIFRGDAAYYRYHPPTSDDIVLLLEVSSDYSSMNTGMKAKVYAQAALQDYWVLDICRTQLHIFRQPEAEGYRQKQTLQPGDSTRLLFFDDVVAQLQLPTPIRFLTRRNRERNSHLIDRSPLRVTRHSALLTSSLSDSHRSPTTFDLGSSDRTTVAQSFDLAQLPTAAPQSVPSPRFLIPAATQT